MSAWPKPRAVLLTEMARAADALDTACRCQSLHASNLKNAFEERGMDVLASGDARRALSSVLGASLNVASIVHEIARLGDLAEAGHASH